MNYDPNNEVFFDDFCKLESSPLQLNNQVFCKMDTGLSEGPSRNTTLRRKKPKGQNPFNAHTLEEKNCVKPEINLLGQSFWKFHVLKFGSSLYLTTNPTLRHIHCRNAPGYFVKISGSALNYSMSFEDIESGELLVEVRKVSLRSSNYFDFAVRSKRVLRDGYVRDREEIQMVRSPQGSETGRGLFSTSSQIAGTHARNQSDSIWSEAFLGRLVRKVIPPVLLPVAPAVSMLNFESKMADGQNWSVGSIPRYRESRINSNETKYIAKRNVHFHRCFTCLKGHPEWDVPPVLALYRECESRSKKRVIRKINRLSRVGSLLGSKELPPQSADLYNEVTSYKKCGDGLYYDKVPSDDEPDYHHKLGWATIYEDKETLSQQGMFDLVIALTVAIGYESQIHCGPIE